jgi:hypothetical protein
MAQAIENILDLVKMTNRDFGKYKWTELGYDLQQYFALPHLMKEKKVKFRSGNQLQWNVRTSTSGQAKNVRRYEVDTVNKTDHMQQGVLPWRSSTVNWSLDEVTIAVNREPARIVEMVQEARTDSLIDWAKLAESNWWNKPVNDADDTMPHGVMYSIVKHITGTSVTPASGDTIPGGFNGGNPSGFSSGVGGLSSSTYTDWANWTFKYVNVSQNDLIRRWRKAATFTYFMSPVPVPEYNRGDDMGYYMPYEVYGPLEESLEAQNDNLGNDIASKDGKVHFRGTPCYWVPKLDSDSDKPVYGINWGMYYPVFLDGWFMKERGPEYAPSQHNVIVNWNDSVYNFCCKDRRRNFVGAKALSNTELG